MEFSQLTLKKPLLRAVTEAGYTQPSPIQKKAIPPVLTGRDLLGCAQTGTGKTAAFALPILQRLDAPQKHIRALILTPTRELALQIFENFEQYGKYTKLRSTVIFGGVGQGPQVAALRRGVDILVATPGRLNDLIGQGHIKLDRVEIFVLDEADRMLDMGFVHDVKRVIAQLPQKRQTLLFSATLPDEIVDLADSLLHDPAKVFVTPVSSTVDTVEQCVYRVDKGNKRHLLAKLLQGPDVHSALVFTRTKHGADRVARDLNRAGIPAAAIHGNKSQNARQDALARFKQGKIKALVATDIAARGIDIHELSHVVNFDLPNIPETYVHRIGRTGRAGHEGIAISFCDANEAEYLRDIEKLIGFKVKEVKNHDWPAVEAVAGPAKPAPRSNNKKTVKNAEKNPQKNKQKSKAEQPAPQKAPPKAPENVPKKEAKKPEKKPAAGAQRGRNARGPRGPRPADNPYENRQGGSAIITRKPMWGGSAPAPAPAAPEKEPGGGQQQPAKAQGDDDMARNRRRGGKNRGKKNPGAQGPAANKPAAPVIPKNPNGLFDFTEAELAEDTSLQVISRRDNTEAKYASFEDFLKDKGLD